MGLFDFLDQLKKRWTSKKNRISPVEAEALRIDFKERYHSFRMLLSANNKALEIMGDIERSLKGEIPFGMAFVKARCTAVSVNVLRMIRKLGKLAPGKYDLLLERYDAIQAEIARTLIPSRTSGETPQAIPLVIPLEDINRELADVVGGKMAHLGELKNRVGLNVPAGFSITVAAYDRFLAHNDLQTEIDRRIQAATLDNMARLVGLSTEIRQLIMKGEMPPDLSEAILSAVEKLPRDDNAVLSLALRSSALGEDASGASFAGQYHSALNVSADHIFDAYKEVIASKYGVPALTYRLNRGFRDEDIAMAVACICMVDALAGGVVYTRSPVAPSDHAIYISAAWGLPKSVVDGSIACDLFVVSRGPEPEIIRSVVENKEKKFVCYPEEGVCRIDLTGDTAAMPCLEHAQMFTLAALAEKIEAYYGAPQDIEWALPKTAPDAVYVLQCRPLQQTGTDQHKARDGLSPVERPATVLAGGGITASPGAAAGPAYVAEKAADILGFPENAVLVVRQALPQWAPLMDRAAAVVSEQGGFAGHLANVAREFGVPALFRLPGIVEKLTNGDLITVDADGICIHRGRIESLLAQNNPQRYIMRDSPVYHVLQRVSRHITPLHLLDPDSPDFRPGACKTLHDITRFIHEKSVHEMFSFGDTHHFAEKSGKQLYYKVPMQWWILDLDDGFKSEVNGRYVRIEDIASIPMLALWDGILAVPWDGPPPVDGKGLMSVMFQATANPALNTGMRTQYAERNYFMISKEYCSLSSRLGFHFSTIEAFVSQREPENYISFRFKGGAADARRRILRVEFIASLLEEYGFGTKIRSDHLQARMEGGSADVLRARLKMLGYLILHTRQLDMIMSKPGVVKRYYEKFKSDIKKITTDDDNVSRGEQ